MKLLFKTKNLLIRPYKRADAQQVWQTFSEKKVYDTTYSIPHPYPREMADKWIFFVNQSMRKGFSYEFAIFDRLKNTYLGNVGLINVYQEQRNADITYLIHPDYWGMGYASEAALAVISFGFNELNLKRISGRCMVKNKASAKVMEKCGFIYEGTARCEIFKDNEFIDTLHYAVINDKIF